MDRIKSQYCWKGINSAGERVEGIISAANTAIVKTELYQQGIKPTQINQKKDSFFAKKITSEQITLFCRQTATLIKAGVPLIQTLAIVLKSQANSSMRYLIADIQNTVASGLGFAAALGKHAVFSEFICNLVAVGEKTGNLELILEKVASYKEQMEKIRKKLKKAFAYPLVVLLVAILVSFVLLTVVVPQFEILFKSFGAKLPLLTRLIIQFSNAIINHGLRLFVGVSVLIYSIWFIRRRCKLLLDKFFLKLPLLGVIFTKAIIARFARTLAISFAAGLPLVEALKAAAGVTDNSLYKKAIDKICEEVYAGKSLQMAMQNTFLFSNMVVQMIAIGEQSGTLEIMLAKIASYYEEEVNSSVDILTDLLEPVIMAVLGLIVGILVIAMYLPIFKLGSVI